MTLWGLGEPDNQESLRYRKAELVETLERINKLSNAAPTGAQASEIFSLKQYYYNSLIRLKRLQEADPLVGKVLKIGREKVSL